MIGFDQNSSVSQIYTDIRSALGASNPALPVPSEVFTRIALIWQGFQDKTLIYPRLQYWFTRRQVLDMVLGGQWQYTDFSEAGVEQKYSQQHGQLHTLRDDADAEIKTLLAQAQASRAPAVGQLTATSPGPVVSPNCPNPNSPRYSGSPLFREWWGRY